MAVSRMQNMQQKVRHRVVTSCFACPLALGPMSLEVYGFLRERTPELESALVLSTPGPPLPALQLASFFHEWG